MKCCFCSVCLLLAIFMCSSMATTTASLVQPLCKDLSKADPKNVNYDFCVSQLESDPQSSYATAPQVGGISFELSISKANAISSVINKFLEVPTLNPPVKIALQDCSTLYSEIPNNLEAGLQALKAGDFWTANVKVSAVLTAAETCGEGITNNEDTSQIIKMNDEFYKLAAISLGFTNLLRIEN